MTQFLRITGGVTASKGFYASGIHCGIRKNRSKRDLALIFSDTMCDAAAVHTTNKVKGAPNVVTADNLKDGRAQALICNSGNANTCNADGIEKARRMCQIVAERLNLRAEDVIVASTGVIGQVLPIEPIEQGADELVSMLSKNGAHDAAEAIMTTDTRLKEYAVEFVLNDKKCTMGAMAKGSGMIHPNMATMLCFITTDVSIDHVLLREALLNVSDDTFNMVSVDGDTSTNDMVCIMASGCAQNERIVDKGKDYDIFVSALRELLTFMSKEIARDGEGATKLLICDVHGAKDVSNAKIAAKAVICSSLTKAAMFGEDANWGRVLCAIGYSGADVDVNRLDVSFVSTAGRIDVCKNGAGVDFSEEEAKRILSQDEITIDVTLYEGSGGATAYGCDLTYDYVKINGDYRT